MKFLTKMVVVFSSAAILTSGLVAVIPPETAIAQEDMAVACADELDLTVPNVEEKGKTPVLLVHGRGSEGGIWSQGNPSMEDILRLIDYSVLVDPFDYQSESNKWVANSDAAHRLAKTIVCYYLLYGEEVAVVAHSMGGLMTYEALDWAAYGVYVRDAMGYIASIGSPFEGSWLATGVFETAIAFCKLVGLTQIGQLVMEELCREANSDWSTSGLSYDSEQLEALPDLPDGIAHKAIAGRIQMEVCFFGCAQFSIGDGVVPSESATARYTDTGVGDGVTIFDCTVSEGAWCSHSGMLQDERVQYEVKASIEAYMVSQMVEKTDFYGLQLPINEEDWKVVYPEDGTNWAYTDDVHAIIVDNHCVTNDEYGQGAYVRMFCPGFSIVNMNEPGYEDWMPYEPGYDCHTDWLHDNYSLSGPHDPEKVTIGGVEAIHQEHWLCEYDDHWNPVPPEEKPDYISHSWLIPDKGLLIFDFYNEGPDSLPGLEELLAGASWS